MADFLVPLASSILGGLISILGGLLIVARSDWFRRRAHWEPYARELWIQQVALCSELMTSANIAMQSATYCFDVFNPDKKTQTTWADRLHKQIAEMGSVKGKRLLLCTANFNQSFEGFFGQLLVILEQFRNGNLNQKLAGNLSQLWFDLVDSARTEIRVEPIDAQARAAMEADRTAPPFNPTGNPTLPY